MTEDDWHLYGPEAEPEPVPYVPPEPTWGAGRRYNGMKWIRHSTRWAIYWRDRNRHRNRLRCLWCNREQWHPTRKPNGVRLSLDHLVPVKHGGTHAPSNLITSCVACNSRRGACPFEDWLDSGQFDLRVYRRIVTCLARPLDREKGRRLAAARPPANPWRPRQFLDRA